MGALKMSASDILRTLRPEKELRQVIFMKSGLTYPEIQESGDSRRKHVSPNMRFGLRRHTGHLMETLRQLLRLTAVE